MSVMIAVVAVVSVSGLISMLAVRRSRVEATALAMTVGLQILVPAFGPSHLLRAGVPAICICYLLLAFLRRERRAASTSFPFAIVIFIGYLTVSNFIGARMSVIGYWALLGALLILSALLAATAPNSARAAVRVTLLISIPTELILAVGEQLKWVPTLWPRGEASDNIANRAHQFLPLIGRSEGTAGHPILLGTLSAVGVIVAVWSLLHTRRWIARWGYLLLALMAVTTALLSGTRSALLATGGCLLLWILTTRTIPLVLRICALAGAGVLGYGKVMSVATDLLNSVRGTTSFEHRFGVIGNVPRLLARPGGDFWFGYGGGTDVAALFHSGVIAGTDQLTYFDNQWVRLLALSGVVGVVLCATMVLAGLRRSDQLGRLLILLLVMMFLSFDLFTWVLPSLLLVLATAGPMGAGSTVAVPNDLPDHVIASRRRPLRRAWEYQ